MVQVCFLARLIGWCALSNPSEDKDGENNNDVVSDAAEDAAEVTQPAISSIAVSRVAAAATFAMKRWRSNYDQKNDDITGLTLESDGWHEALVAPLILALAAVVEVRAEQNK